MNLSIVLSLIIVLEAPLEAPARNEERAELLAACSRALPEEDCAFEHHALGRVVDDVLTSRIESLGPNEVRVTVRRGGQSLTSRLVFESHDDPLERARAIGLTAGVLGSSIRTTEKEQAEMAATPDARAGEPTEDAESRRAPPKQTEAVLRPPSQEELERESDTPTARQEGTSETPREAFLGVYGGAGYDAGTTSFEVGGAVHAGVGVADGVSIAAGAHFFLTPEQGTAFRALRIAPSLGIAHGADFAGWRSLVMLQGGAELYSVRSAPPAPPAEGSRWSPLLRATWMLGVPVTDHVMVQVAPELVWYLSPTTVFIGNEAVATTATVRPSLLLGVSLATPDE